jgi:hypothetical protein
LPQLWQGAANSAGAEAVPVIAANADSFLRNSVPLQPGQAGAGDELRTRTSNSLPQALH